jgi:2-polyprenyl-3-methyl-5-hydroxy-6-metoxy-1,4-benzoquinol methylase
MPPTCPNCASASHEKLKAFDVNRRTSDKTFTYFQCTACQLVFVSPVPADLGSYYHQDYYAIPSSLEALAASAEQQRHKIDTVTQFTKTGKLPEIGSSYGDFAYLAQRAGFEVDVIEMDADCCAFLERTLHIRAVNHNDPIQALRGLGTYDVIALWQVIEHVPDPWGLMHTIAEHLNPNGIAVFGAPNPDALQFNLFGTRWAHLDAPRHLQLIPIPAFVQRMAGHQLKSVLNTTSDGESQKANVFGWKKSIMNMLGVYVAQTANHEAAHLSDEATGRSLTYRLKRGALRGVTGLLQLLLSRLEGQNGRGCSYTLVFQKPAS